MDDFRAAPLRADRRRMMRAPASLQDTIRRFSRFRPAEGLDAWFDEIDWSGVSRRQLCHAFLDRPPASPAEAEEPAGFDPRAASRALYGSAAFRQDLLARLLHAFPGKRRLLFVHLPKCAGSDFEQVLSHRMPLLRRSWESLEALPPASLAVQLKRLADMVAKVETLACGGHLGLSWYLDHGLFRWQDRLVTIVREPTAIALSFANYVVKRFGNDPALGAIDTRGWARVLRLDRFDPEMPEAELRALALRIVTLPGLMQINPLCSLLGDGTAAGAFAQLARVPIEITTVERYDAWLGEHWGSVVSKRVNTSPPVIGWRDLAPEQQQRIAESSREDLILFAAVRRAIGDRVSTTGPEVVAAAS